MVPVSRSQLFGQISDSRVYVFPVLLRIICWEIAAHVIAEHRQTLHIKDTFFLARYLGRIVGSAVGTKSDTVSVLAAISG